MTRQSGFAPAQAPDHPVNTEPEAGSALSSTVAPVRMAGSQSGGQETPQEFVVHSSAPMLVRTTPEPLPAEPIARPKADGIGGSVVAAPGP